MGLATRRCRIRGEESPRPACGFLLDDKVGDSEGICPDRFRWRTSRGSCWGPSRKPQAVTPIAMRLFAMAAQCAERATPLSPL